MQPVEPGVGGGDFVFEPGGRPGGDQGHGAADECCRRHQRHLDQRCGQDLVDRAPESGPSTVQVTAQAPGVDSTATFTRTFFPGPVSTRTLALAHDQISGVYVAPARPTSSRPAVLLLLLSYPDAGHYVNFLIANRPIDTAADDKGNGSTPQSNPDADADTWPKILARLTGT